VDYKIIWTESGIYALEQILDYFAHERPNIVAEVRGRVHATVDQLIQFPLMGAKTDIENAPSLRELYCHPYRIFYRVSDRRQEVHVVNLWHAARDEPTRADLLG
jgi:plasmid stabilization system protein ParE